MIKFGLCKCGKNMLAKLFGKRMDLEFLAISVDEGILGAHDESLKFAKSLCKKLGFALMIPSNHHKGA